MKIVVEKISKSFKDLPIVQEISFSVEPGMILGLMGPNGAGKTTTLRMLLDILKPDEGKIRFDDRKMNKAIRNSIGYLPEERGIYQKYKVVDVLAYFGRLKNLPKRKSHVEAVRLLDRFEMIEVLEDPVGHLSKGMQQKLQFLVTIIHDPQIVIMDEPFWGLDPLNQELMRSQILWMKEQGKSVLLSTHQLREAETLCDYFILIDDGRIVLEGNLDKIRKNFQQDIIIVEADDDLTPLRELAKVQKVEIRESRAMITVGEPSQIDRVLKDIIGMVKVSRVEIEKPTLNDIFLQTVRGKKQAVK